MSDKMFVGYGNGQPFSLGTTDPYVFDLRGASSKFLFKSGRVNTGTGWSDSAIKANATNGTWAYISLDKMKELFPDVIFDASQQKTDTNSTRVEKLTEVKKSALYFNLTTGYVERVITIQDKTLIWTSKHKEMARPYPRSAFRIATKEEVNKYLEAAKHND